MRLSPTAAAPKKKIERLEKPWPFQGRAQIWRLEPDLETAPGWQVTN